MSSAPLLLHALQAYSISKVLSEREATKFAEENGLSLVTLCPVVAVGASPAVRVDTSVPACLSLITGEELSSDHRMNETRSNPRTRLLNVFGSLHR